MRDIYQIREASEQLPVRDILKTLNSFTGCSDSESVLIGTFDSEEAAMAAFRRYEQTEIRELRSFYGLMLSIREYYVGHILLDDDGEEIDLGCMDVIADSSLPDEVTLYGNTYRYYSDYRCWRIVEDEEEEEEAEESSAIDATTKIFKNVFDVTEDHENVNSYLKAMVINFGDERGDIIVTNDNFGTSEPYACFNEGKKAAGLHPLQIVFSGVSMAKATHERYIDKDGNICTF